MKLIVGLGNPGKKYEATRHNVGFMVIDYLADIWGLNFTKHSANALIASSIRDKERVILVKPQTYMNLSGSCVSYLIRYYRLSPQDLIVVYDDLDLSPGILRIRPSGASGGHRGLRSIMDCLGTQEIQRIKIGIGRPAGDSTSYVLGIFSEAEWDTIGIVIQKAAEAIEALLVKDLQAVMNAYNKDYSLE